MHTIILSRKDGVESKNIGYRVHAWGHSVTVGALSPFQKERVLHPPCFSLRAWIERIQLARSAPAFVVFLGEYAPKFLMKFEKYLNI